MSIKLIVEDYCENCPNFEPDINRIQFERFSDEFHEYVYICDTLIKCKTRATCHCIEKQIRNHLNEEEKDHDFN